MHADRAEQRHLPARLHSEARASRVAAAARRARSSTNSGARRQCATTLGSAIEGARWATVELFESPNFIYRAGAGSRGRKRGAALSGYEMASRLSFLIWNSLPDQTLMDQAASGMLGTADGIRTAATRMLDASAGRESVGNFAEEYLRLDRIGDPGEGPGAVPRVRTESAGGDGPRHARHLGVAGVRRSSERDGPVHDHEGRGERRSREAVRPRRHGPHLDDVPDAVVAGGRAAGRNSEQGGPCCRSSRTSNRAPPRCAASSSANR